MPVQNLRPTHPCEHPPMSSRTISADGLESTSAEPASGAGPVPGILNTVEILGDRQPRPWPSEDRAPSYPGSGVETLSTHVTTYVPRFKLLDKYSFLILDR